MLSILYPTKAKVLLSILFSIVSSGTGLFFIVASINPYGGGYYTAYADNFYTLFLWPGIAITNWLGLKSSSWFVVVGLINLFYYYILLSGLSVVRSLRKKTGND